MVTRMSEERFEALGMWCRAAGTREVLTNCSYFSADDERLIGATFFARDKDLFAYVLLARDAHDRFQGFEESEAFHTLRAAEEALKLRLHELDSKPTPDVPMRKDTRKGVDLFAPIKGARLNPKFVNLRDRKIPSAAREYLREMARWIVDLDENLVRDFQTTGFDSRTWEFCLQAAFTWLGFGFDRSDAVPDFRLRKGETKFFVEAVTANPTGNVEFDIKQRPPHPPGDFWSFMENEMPQKFGSPLRSKLAKKYWEREDVAGHPFLIAIADFHAPGSMIWSQTALPLYLYGIGFDVKEREDGSKYAVKKTLQNHVVGDKVIPANFFAQETSRQVSAVLFSNAGTMAKFNRMGARAGFGDSSVSLVRQGGYEDPTPGSFEPIPFRSNVEDPLYRERWSDEIEIYHNPNAAVPLPEDVFAGTTQFSLQGEDLIRRGPSPRILFSTTGSLGFSE